MRMRFLVLHYVARALGVLIHIEGMPYGAAPKAHGH
jgi:hypothetical protein